MLRDESEKIYYRFLNFSNDFFYVSTIIIKYSGFHCENVKF